PFRRGCARRSAMNQNDHRIFFSGFDFRRRNQPALDIKSSIRPLDAFRFPPGWRNYGVVFCQLTPSADVPSPDLWRRFITAANHRDEFPIFCEREIWKITESMKALRPFPNCAHGIAGHAQFRDRASATDILGEKNSIRRLPEN